MENTYLNDYIYHNPNFKVVKKQAEDRSAEVDLLHKKSSETTNSTEFDQIVNKKNSCFSTDKKHGIAQISWSGQVDIHTAKKLIRLGFEAIEQHGYNKLILDHSSLVVFETEARVWVKELLKHKAETVSDKLTMLASISPKTAIGSVYSSFAGDIMKSEMPHLKMKRFDEIEKAIEWLS